MIHKIIIQEKIKQILVEWNLDLQDLNHQREIIAIHFGAQKVYVGFELYLSGHSWYDGHDLWLLDVEWTPKRNYIALGGESLIFDRLEILEIYEKIIEEEIQKEKSLYNKLIVLVGLSDGEPKRLN